MASAEVKDRGRKKESAYRWAVVSLIVVIFLFLFPPVRIASTDSSAAEGRAAEASFDAGAFAERFWNERLIPHLNTATPVNEVLVAMAKDPAKALEQHGHKVGIGTTSYYFVRGGGEVLSVERSRAIVDTGAGKVAIRLGPVFGNTIRDGTGLLELGDAPGIEAFNALSAALNQKVEQSVIAPAREISQPGARITFAGCAPAPETLGDGPALEIVPLWVEAAD